MRRLSLWSVLFFLLTTSPCRSADCPGLGGHLNGENIENFIGCSRVAGSVVINEVSFQSGSSVEPLTMDKLSLLSNITEVDGYVQVENTNHAELTHLRFLHNLETIHGHETLEVLPTQYYSLIISGNDFLETLNLASLRRVENGGIRITNNQELCLVDTISIEDYLIGSSLNKIGGYAEDCSDVSCHAQCEQSRGCWGTLADECVQCRSFSYLGTCVEACNESISYVDDATMSCIPLPTTSSVPGGALPPSYTLSGTKTDSTSEADAGNHTTITRFNVTDTPWPEATTDVLLEAPRWQITTTIISTIIGAFGLLLVLIILVLVIVRKITKRKDEKSLAMKIRNGSKLENAQVIQVGKPRATSQNAGLREAMLTRRQHVCSRRASDEAYNHGHDAASPEPEVVVMVDRDDTLDNHEERYVKMPYETVGDLNDNPQSGNQDNISTSCDYHVTESASPLYQSIDSQPYHEVVPQGRSSKPNESTHVKSYSQFHNSGSPFHRSLTVGAVYSTRTTKSHQMSSHTHTYSPPPSHRSSLASSHGAPGARGGQRTVGRGSRMGHRLGTAGAGSVVSSSRAGTSTQGSVNSIMTMNE